VKSYVFKVVIEEDQFEDGRPGFSAHRPSLKEAYTWGETKEEALERIPEDGFAEVRTEGSHQAYAGIHPWTEDDLQRLRPVE
jgi:hypothetical protein